MQRSEHNRPRSRRRLRREVLNRLLIRRSSLRLQLRQPPLAPSKPRVTPSPLQTALNRSLVRPRRRVEAAAGIVDSVSKQREKPKLKLQGSCNC
jgi:hypothetical protein